MTDAKTLGFEFAHLGINQKGADESKNTVGLLNELFGFEVRETDGSWFVNEQFEIMKKPFRGKNGHIAVRTNNAAAARDYLEEKGLAFDESTALYDENGKLRVIYTSADIAGFAFHLVQKS